MYELVGADLVYKPVGHNKVPGTFTSGGYALEFQDTGEISFDFFAFKGWNDYGENEETGEDTIRQIEVYHSGGLEMLFINEQEIDCYKNPYIFNEIPKVSKVIETFYEAFENDTDDENLEFECALFELHFENTETKESKSLRVI